jgi:hypothetical protein
MTIAAGMLCVDGLAVAADTKEGYGDTHTYVDKLTTAGKKGGWAGVIAGSGEGYLLDYMTPRIRDLFEDEIDTLTNFENRLAECMAEMYESKSIKSYPADKASDLYTQFLVGAKLPQETDTALFVVNSTLVTRATDFGTIIGCGPLREVGKEFGQVAPFGLERAKEAALCIVHEAKRRYSDVGGDIQIVCVSNSGESSTHRGEGIVRKEELLDRVRTMTNHLTVSVLDSSLTTSHFNGILRNIDSKLRGYHKEAQLIDKEAGRAERQWFREMYKKGEKRHFKRLASQT